MNKIITQKEIDAVMALLNKYNVGVQEFIAVQQMFEKMPVAEEKKETVEKEVKKS
jgi:hypothetical protein